MNYIVRVLYSDTCKRTKSWKCKVRHLRFCTILSALLEAPKCPTYNKCSSWQVMVFVRGFPYLQLKRFLCLYLSSYPPISLRVKGMATHWSTYPGLCEEFCQVHYFTVPLLQNQSLSTALDFTTPHSQEVFASKTFFFLISPIICPLYSSHFMNFLHYFLSSFKTQRSPCHH